MLRTILRFAPVAVCISALAADNAIPSYVLGMYRLSHEERDYGTDCSKKDDTCGLVAVNDEVSIERISRSRAKVQIFIVGGNLHTCEATAEGEWQEPILKVDLKPGDGEAGICTVSVKFDDRNNLSLNGEPYSACSRYCGARASLFTQGLRRVATP